MAVTLVPDIIEGAQIETAPGDLRITRVFLALNIPTTTPSAVLPLSLGADGLPRWGEAHPDVPSASVQRYIVRGTGEPFSARIDVIYQQASVGAFATWYVVDDTVLAEEMTEINDGGGPIRAKFTPPPTTTTPGFSPAVGGPPPLYFYGPVPRLRPRRTLTVTGLVTRPPKGDILDAIGCVNSQVWEGKRPGWWLCTRARAEAHLFTKQLVAESGFQPRGMSVTYGFASRVRRNWMEFFGYRDHQGKLVNISQKAVYDALAGEYQYDQIEFEKFSIIGNYPMLDFRDTFGFGESGDITPSIGNSFGSSSRT